MKRLKPQQRFSIKQFTNASGTQSYRVSGIKRSGERVRQNYAELATAQVRQIELETEYLAGHSDVTVRATKLSDTQIRLAETAFAKLDGEHDLLVAVDYWLKHGRHHAVKHSPRLDDAVEQFVAWVDATESLRDTSKGGLKYRVKMFANSTGNVRVDSVTPEMLDTYLDGRKGVSAVTRHNDLRAISRFFAWCIERERRWVTLNPASVIKIDLGSGQEPPAILSVPDCERLLRTAQKYQKGKLVPYVAVCLFAGLRPDEAKRLTWAQVNFSDGEIRLEANQSKTGRSRVIALNATLRAWLEAYPGREFYPPSWERHFGIVKKAAGFGTVRDLKDENRKHLKLWPVDVMRHTAISHFFRSCGSYGLTAERHGNSEAVIKAHYQGRVSTEDTKKFYAIMPKTKVV